LRALDRKSSSKVRRQAQRNGNGAIGRLTSGPKTIPAPIAYQILTGLFIPRPIGFISSISAAVVRRTAWSAFDRRAERFLPARSRAAPTLRHN
jgi:hypothetical protein